MEILIKLVIEFFVIGFFSYGGGLAVLVLLQERVINLGWMNLKEFADVIAISQSTPGPLAINLATFVGFFQGGIEGAVIASVAVVIPGVVFSMIIGRFMEHFDENERVKSILKGLRAVVIGLVATAIFNIALVTIFDIDSFKKTGSITSFFDIKACIAMVIFFVFTFKLRKSPALLIIAGGVVGILLGNF